MQVDGNCSHAPWRPRLQLEPVHQRLLSWHGTEGDRRLRKPIISTAPPSITAEQEARQKQEEADGEKTQQPLQESQRQRDVVDKATEANKRGAASKQAQAEGEKTAQPPKQREGLRGMLSNRVDRRSACRQQAEERDLTGRKASRYTRLC